MFLCFVCVWACGVPISLILANNSVISTIFWHSACQLLFKSETLYFTPGSLVADMREPADRIMIVSNGSIDLYAYSCDPLFNRGTIDVSHFSWSNPVLDSYLAYCHPTQVVAVPSYIADHVVSIHHYSSLPFLPNTLCNSLLQQLSSKFRARVLKRGWEHTYSENFKIYSFFYD